MDKTLRKFTQDQFDLLNQTGHICTIAGFEGKYMNLPYWYKVSNDNPLIAEEYTEAPPEIARMVDKWIWVACSRPENRAYVLTYNYHDEEHRVLQFKHGMFFDGLERVTGVTHWQPLPQPPKKSNV